MLVTASVLLIAVTTACSTNNGASARSSSGGPSANCAVTLPNGVTVPGQIGSGPGQVASGDGMYGNDALSVALQPGGRVIAKPDPHDGSIGMKFMWWRGVKGNLQITGQRLDAPAKPALAGVPGGYGDRGFQASGIVFPTAGCWQVTGSVGAASLTFVTQVVGTK